MTDNENQYPTSDELKDNKEALSDAIAMKVKLEEMGVPTPPQLQERIDELGVIKIPKWTMQSKWIKTLESRKKNLQSALDALGNISLATKRKLETEIQRIDETLNDPREELGDISRREYSTRVQDVLGLSDDLEEENDTKKLFKSAAHLDLLMDIYYPNNIIKQYKSTVDTLRETGLLTDENYPSKEKVREFLEKNTSPEQAEVIRKMEKPTLQLVPNRTCKEYLAAFDENMKTHGIRSMQIEREVQKDVEKMFERIDKQDNAKTGEITGWKIAITEGADHSPERNNDNNRNREIHEQITQFHDDNDAKKVFEVDIKKYILLQMASFAGSPSRPIDTPLLGLKKPNLNRWKVTLLFDDNNVMSIGWGKDNRALISPCDLDTYTRTNAFRPSVVIDVPQEVDE